MKIASSVPEYPAAFVRRATAWACRAVGVPVGEIHSVRVRRIRGDIAASGLCTHWQSQCRLTVRIGRRGWPMSHVRHGRRVNWDDAVAAFVFVLAHEVAHAWHFWRETKAGAAKSRNAGRNWRPRLPPKRPSLPASASSWRGSKIFPDFLANWR